MAVRDALLALLTAGPAYGFQLHGGLAVRTGGRRTVNVGQTYATLDRLAKQRLVESAGSTDDGLPLHRLTATGADAAEAWLHGADAAGADPWDETIDRVLIARSLPDYDAEAVIATERGRWLARRSEASDAASRPVGPEHPRGNELSADDPGTNAAETALARLAAAAGLARADAALAWLDVVDSETRVTLAPRAQRPKRGRRPGATPKAGAQASASA
ncbi:MAG: PadR family transcriptional regulator [Actinomycetota bacterium]|nr:PadR family transcriptional regulator [Actinomycetota bacterium]